VRSSRPVVRPDRALQLQEGDATQGNVRGVSSAILVEALPDNVLDVHQELSLTSVLEVKEEDLYKKQDVLRVLRRATRARVSVAGNLHRPPNRIAQRHGG
jgi:hypothetical protein